LYRRQNLFVYFAEQVTIYEIHKGGNRMNSFSRYSGDGLFKNIMLSGAAMYCTLIVLI